VPRPYATQGSATPAARATSARQARRRGGGNRADELTPGVLPCPGEPAEFADLEVR
jgi:hypothetical protein